MTTTVLSVAMLAAFALVIGAVVLLRRGLRRQPVLMLVLAAVLLANVFIWTVPTRSGTSLIDSTAPR